MNGFKIIMSSDVEYNDLCAEIYFKEEFVAMLSQEEGFENLKIEIAPCPSGENWFFNYTDFEIALDKAKKALWKMRKID